MFTPARLAVGLEPLSVPANAKALHVSPDPVLPEYRFPRWSNSRRTIRQTKTAAATYEIPLRKSREHWPRSRSAFFVALSLNCGRRDRQHQASCCGFLSTQLLIKHQKCAAPGKIPVNFPRTSRSIKDFSQNPKKISNWFGSRYSNNMAARFDTSLLAGTVLTAKLPAFSAVVPRVFSLPSGIPRSLQPAWRQYVLAFLMFTVVTLCSFYLQKIFGYQAIALVYLLSVVLLALFISRGATLFGTILTAAGWNFFFAPPAFAFNISDTYDNTMLLTYFIVTLIVGQLTARLRAQRDAEINAKLLAESERLSRTLLKSVSHELRTPISAIITAANTLHSTSALSAEQQNLVVEIESASSRLNRVVQSLLSAARIQSGHIHPKLDWCDIADLVRVTLRGIKEQIYNRRVLIFIPKNLPLIRADFILTGQALANLVINASTYAPPDTNIEIVAQIEGDSLALTVSDDGPGLPPDQLERVFDPFERAGTTKTGGLGLGLAIVKGFIEVQGGRVKAANRAGGTGAVFSIYLNALDSPKLSKEML